MAAPKAIVTANATVENGGRAKTVGWPPPPHREVGTHRRDDLRGYLESIAVTVMPESKKFVRIAHRCRTVKIRAGRQIVLAAHPLPGDLNQALARINSAGSAY
jgi:hypothetical protein